MPLGSSCSFGVVGNIQVSPSGCWVHSGSLILFVCALGVGGFILKFGCALAVFGFIQGSLGSSRFKLLVIGFICDRSVNLGSPLVGRCVYSSASWGSSC